MYAELHALSNFSFLRGASHPEELVLQARTLGYRALALTDECSLAGVVRAHVAAKQSGLQLIIGAEFTCADGLKLVALATDRAGYGALSRLISRCRRAAAKGGYALERTGLEDSLDGCLLIWLPRPAARRCRSTRTGAGCASASPAACGSGWNCWAASMRAVCKSWRRSAATSACREWLRATCTCIGAAAGHCRTC